jgi:hypothetical protein
MYSRAIRLLCTLYFGFSNAYDFRTGGGGFGEDGYRRHQQNMSSSSCPILDGSIATLSCQGIIPSQDVNLKDSIINGFDGDNVYEVVYRILPFRDLAIVSRYNQQNDVTRKLFIHFIDSSEYNTCNEFIESPVGIQYCKDRDVGPSDCHAADNCIIQSSNVPEGMYDACAKECDLPQASTIQIDAQRRRHTKITWNFEDGLEGWANASSTEMEAEIYTRGGELRGIVTGTSTAGSAPHFDSPRLSMVVNDKHHLLLRMMYLGPARTGRVIFRTGSSATPWLNSMDHHLSTWANRPNATIVRSSKGSETPKALVDGNPHTGWTASAQDAWVVLDLQGHFEVSQIELVAVNERNSATGGGANQAPKTMKLQVSDSPDGTFTTVYSFNMSNSTTNSSSNDLMYPDELSNAYGNDELDNNYEELLEQEPFLKGNVFKFEGFKAFGRFFRFYCVDNFGGDVLEVRELTLKGRDDSFVSMDFPISGDGQWHTYTLPFHTKLSGYLNQLRVYPCVKAPFVRGVSEVNAYKDFMTEDEIKAILKTHQFTRGGETDTIEPLDSPSPLLGNSFAVDWIKIAVAPTVMRVMGCSVNKYYETESFTTPLHGALVPYVHTTNNYLLSTSFTQAKWISHEYPYSTTYNCLRAGGERVDIFGKHLGLAGSTVTIAGQLCLNLEVVVDEYHFRCTLPAVSEHSHLRDVHVVVSQEDLPLKHDVRYLSYQEPPPQLMTPTISNIASRSLDVSWVPPLDIWTQLTVTGYLLKIRQFGSAFVMERELVVGNTTTTTITGLLPDTTYAVSVAAVSENITDEAWQSFDLYGRRSLLPGAMVGALSVETNATSTLMWDVSFDWFDANATTNQSAQDRRASLGPSGVIGGEGGYGLIIVGDANLENCNESIACCDGFNYSQGITSCSGRTYTCSAVDSVDPYYVDGIDANARQIPYSDPDGSPAASKQVRFWSVMAAERNALRPTAPCGPALRLTPSLARQSGAVWYARQLNVEEGFDTVFSFRVASPSLRCNQMDDAYTHCRSRGGDGIAFVIQEQDPRALGAGGAGLGYTGIQNSMAVEFDTFYNSELLEPYENHIAVHSRGWRHANNANHSFAFASSVKIADIARDVHIVRVAYRPTLGIEAIMSGKFASSAHTSHFFENADFPNGGMADFGTGVGQLEVYFDDLNTPTLVTPINLGTLLKLRHGRAWVGFTASTGHSTWQTQDLLSWHFNQLRLDKDEYPPPVVNGVGAFSCADKGLCVHQ